MRRGEVHFLAVPLPNRDAPGEDEIDLEHFVVTLRGSGPPTEPNVPYVLACRAMSRTVNDVFDYEVFLEGGPTKQLPQDSILDCRWVMTRPSFEFTAGTYRFDLDEDSLEWVSDAITMGLQL